MHWAWKLLIAISLAMNLVGYGAQIVIVDRILAEAAAQTGALMGISKDQQQLRREVGELKKEMENHRGQEL